jgi:hypothetical protein
MYSCTSLVPILQDGTSGLSNKHLVEYDVGEDVHSSSKPRYLVTVVTAVIRSIV